MSIKPAEDLTSGASVIGENLTVGKDVTEGEKESSSNPLDGDAVIENDLEQKPLLEHSEKRGSLTSNIPLLVDEEFKTKEDTEVQLEQTPEVGMAEDSEVKMLDLEENEVKMVDAVEADEKMADSEDGILNPIKINVEDEDVKVDGALSDVAPRSCSTATCAEPMECGSNFTSPKHVLKAHFDDVMMSETTSV